MLQNLFEINVEQLKETDNCLARVCDGTLHLEDRLKALKEIYMSLNTQTKVIIASVVVLGSALHNAVKNASEYSALADFAEQSGLAAKSFQTLANATEKYGGNAETTAKTLANLRQKFEDLKKGGDGAGLKDFFSEKNINIDGVKSLEQLLPIIATKMGELSSESEKINLGKSLGLDDATIKLLSGGFSKFKEDMADAELYSAFSQEDLDRWVMFDDTLADISKGISTIGKHITSTLLPVFQPVFSVIKSIIDFVLKNSEAIRLTVIEIAPILIASLIPIIGVLWSMLSPVLFIVACVAGILVVLYLINAALVAFWHWLTGAHPIIDKLVDKFIEFKNKVISCFKQVGAKLKEVWDSIPQSVQNAVKRLLKVLPKWLLNLLLGKRITATIDIVQNLLQRKENPDKKKSGSHANGIGYVPFDGYLAELHQGESVLDKSEANIWRDLQAGKDAISTTANVPLASVPQGAITNAYQSSDVNKSFTIGDITIQTAATDADGIANDLMDSIKKAFNGLDSGVRA